MVKTNTFDVDTKTQVCVVKLNPVPTVCSSIFIIFNFGHVKNKLPKYLELHCNLGNYLENCSGNICKVFHLTDGENKHQLWDLAKIRFTLYETGIVGEDF